MSSDYEHLVVRHMQNALIIQLIDPKLFDTNTVTELQDEMLRAIDEEKPQNAIVDFSYVVHCSTAVINGLLRAKRRILANDGKLVLCGMTEGIRDAYKMLNLDGTVFSIYDTLQDALDALDAL